MFILRTKSHLQIDILEQAWSSNKLVQCWNSASAFKNYFSRKFVLTQK